MINSELPNWDAASGAAFGVRRFTWPQAYDVAVQVLRIGNGLGLFSFDGWSGWMEGRLTRRLADVIHHEGRPRPGVVYVVPLGDGIPVPGSDDDRTCDRCGHFVPPTAADDEFYVFSITLMANVSVCGGMCAPCMAMENPQGVVAHA
ncbi:MULTISPECIES: hypothetical protein [unclassified Microbacterium]|uniref:hypothetical protein n=1 Tax=unclassified Microbacterium TaxID=2609290 RepID=UPI0030188057